MTAKSLIVAELGEAALLLPQLVAEALIANERVKYAFTLLQAARAAAGAPGVTHSDLRLERLGCQVDNPSFDEVVPGARRVSPRAIWIPHADMLHAAIAADVECMLRAVEADAETGDRSSYRQRFTGIMAHLHAPESGEVTDEYVRQVTSGREEGDSVHRLVMDLHRALNQVQESLTQESVDGASVYNVSQDDYASVRAFMRGVNRTAPLKFDHPGLGTVATRQGDRLVIENDLGTTDAHVIVISVEGREVLVTYTDIHPQRTGFLRRMLGDRVEWNVPIDHRGLGGKGGESFSLHLGRFHAADDDDRDRFLEQLGSRLVFLIDWNRARKRLRHFVRNRIARDVLDWAAAREYGHRAWLEMGAEELINNLATRASPEPLRFGQRLDELLGPDRVTNLLHEVLRETSMGRREGRSPRLIEDRIHAEFLHAFRRAGESVAALGYEHAVIAADLARQVHDAILLATRDPADPFITRTAVRARRWEHDADELVRKAREATRGPEGEAFSEADDIVDGLEETAFLLTLLHAIPPIPEAFVPIGRLAQLVTEATAAFVKCLDSALTMHHRDQPEDLHDLLDAVEDIFRIEQATDLAHREVTAFLVEHVDHDRALHLMARIADVLEVTADALVRSAFRTRERVLSAHRRRS